MANVSSKIKPGQTRFGGFGKVVALFYTIKHIFDGRYFYRKPGVESAFAAHGLCKSLSTGDIIAPRLDYYSPFARAYYLSGAAGQ